MPVADCSCLVCRLFTSGSVDSCCLTMSDIVGKTLSSLPGLLAQDAGAGKLAGTSKLGTLIRSITALSSRQDEEKLIQQELANLKITVSSPSTSLRQMKECMVRLIYCEMLGYEASFGYIHAIKLAQQGNLLEKRVGYLAVSLFLHENHELLVLLVNTVLKDLQSTNLVEVCMALTVVSQIFPREMIPAVLPLIEDKLKHSKEIIRRKAVLALHKFYLIAPNQVQHIHDRFRKALCDRDAGVMAASLHIYLQIIKDKPSEYKDLTGSFVTILKQVVGGKLPVDFNYHSVPAPWLQIQLLRILGLLGKDDPSASDFIYDVLDESLRRAELNHNITYAILFECVQTIYTIYPKSDLFEKAAKCIGKFVVSPKINLKYLGLKALTYVIQQDPNLALQHQMTIIECLDHPDPILKRETLELLYRITNGQNVTVIVEKMLDYLKQSKEEYTVINLVGKIAELAEKYSPNNEWFIQTMNAVFSVGGDVMHPDIPNNFLRLLAEGFEDEEENLQLRLNAVRSYITLLDQANVYYPQRFLHVICWVLGEYSYLQKDVDPEKIMSKLFRLLENISVTSETKAWAMAAITKLSAFVLSSHTVDELIQNFSTSADTCMRQHAFELKHLREDTAKMRSLLPVDASCEDLAVDASLSFLDEFVAEALSCGAAPYKPHHQRQEEKLCQEKALNFEPYELSFPSSVPLSGVSGRQSPTGISLASELSGNSAEVGLKEPNHRKPDVKKVWGKEGYLLKKESRIEAPTEVKTSTLNCTSLGEDISRSLSCTDQLVNLVSPEEKEKQQLASSLFVGLGFNTSVNLMGKADTSIQKFRRKKKTKDTTPIDKMTSLQNSTTTSFSPLPNTEENTAQPFQHTEPLSFRNSSVVASDLLDISRNQGKSKSLNGTGFNEGLSYLFANTSLEVFRHPQTVLSSLVEPSPPLPDHLAEHSHSETKEIVRTESLGIYSYKVWKEDCLLLVLFIANRSTSTLTSVSLTFANTETFKVVDNLSCHFPMIKSQAVDMYQGCIEMTQPSTQGVIIGHIECHMEPEIHTQFEFSLTLLLLDFIRPLKLTTEEFGTLWLSFSNDVKQNIKLPGTQESLVVALNTFHEKLRFHIVEVIGDEGLVACQLLPSTPCLLHCRIQAGMLVLWFRSPSSMLPDCLLYYCQKELENY
ncbi:AP-4 complex subunit epsilon-1 isoform X4 [Lissotriton helveticus]